MGDISMERKEIVKSIVEELINELCPATHDNVKKAIKRSHDKATKLSKTKTPDEWTKKDMDDSVKGFRQQQYAEKKFGVNCSFRDKLNYIKETIASMFDGQPIQVVGKDPMLKKDKKKEDKCQKQ